MFLLNISKNITVGIILLSFGASCSTQLEERASMDFEPTMPSTPKNQKKDKYGSIYSNSQQGLFATDRRASKVGDLLTVALSENLVHRNLNQLKAQKMEQPALIFHG